MPGPFSRTGKAGGLVLALAVLTVAVLSHGTDAAGKRKSSYALVGIGLSGGPRTGHYDIRDRRQEIDLPALWTGSVAGGWRKELGPRLRFQGTLRLNLRTSYAGARDTLHSVPLNDGTEVSQLGVYYELRHAGLMPELHLVLPARERFLPYVRLGAGGNIVRIRETGRILDAGDTRGANVELPDQRSRVMARWDVLGGFGFTAELTRDYILDISFAGTYWRPVSFDYNVDLPLHDVRYWESHLKFGGQIALVWRLGKA